MPKPIANAKPFTGELIGEYLLTLQKGTATDAAGLDQMTKLKLNVLRDYILQGVAPALHPVSQSGSTLPENPANGDYFFADTTFTVSGKTYTQGHMYTWDGTEWKDTSDIFSQYATQAQVDDLQLKVDALDGLDFKGSITEAQLEQITPSSENKGWMYYVSDLGVYKASDGANWVTVIDYVTQIVESGNTTQAPSSDAVYKMKTDLESRISANSKEISNLKQKAGTEFSVDYPSPTYGMDGVPANVAEYAKVTKLRGVTRARNNMAKALNANNWTTEFGAGVSYSDGVATLTPTAQYGRLACKVEYVANHIVLTSAKIKLSNTSNVDDVTLAIYAVDNVHDGVRHAQATTEWQTITAIVSSSSSSSNNRIMITDARTSDWGTIQIKDVVCTDLTVHFDGSIPSDADTIAKIQQNYPELLIPSAYGSSLVSTRYEGVRSTFRNLLDPSSLRVGDYNNTTTLIRVSSNVENRPYITAGTYTISQKTAGVLSLWLMISDENNVLLETPVVNVTTKYATATFTQSGYLTVIFGYANDTAITPADVVAQEAMVLKGSSDATYAPYRDPVSLSLPAPVDLRCAGSVAEEYDLESGEKTNPIGSVNLGTLSWYYDSAYTRFFAEIADAKPTVSEIPANYRCAKYVNVSPNVFDLELPNMAVRGGVGSGMVWIRDTSYNDATTFKNAMNGVILYYEKATALAPTQLDPVLDPFIEVEGGETIRPIQSQATEIDSSMTAEYFAIGA